MGLGHHGLGDEHVFGFHPGAFPGRVPEPRRPADALAQGGHNFLQRPAGDLERGRRSGRLPVRRHGTSRAGLPHRPCRQELRFVDRRSAGGVCPGGGWLGSGLRRHVAGWQGVPHREREGVGVFRAAGPLYLVPGVGAGGRAVRRDGRPGQDLSRDRARQGRVVLRHGAGPHHRARGGRAGQAAGRHRAERDSLPHHSQGPGVRIVRRQSAGDPLDHPARGWHGVCRRARGIDRQARRERHAGSSGVYRHGHDTIGDDQHHSGGAGRGGDQTTRAAQAPAAANGHAGDGHAGEQSVQHHSGYDRRGEIGGLPHQSRQHGRDAVELQGGERLRSAGAGKTGAAGDRRERTCIRALSGPQGHAGAANE